MPRAPPRRKTRRYCKELAEKKEQQKKEKALLEVGIDFKQKAIEEKEKQTNTIKHEEKDAFVNELICSEAKMVEVIMEPSHRSECYSNKRIEEEKSVEVDEIKEKEEKKPKKTHKVISQSKEKETIERSVKQEKIGSTKVNDNSENSISDSVKSHIYKNTLALTHKNLCNQGKESSVRIKERDRRIVRWMDEALRSKDLIPYPNPTPMVRM